MLSDWTKAAKSLTHGVTFGLLVFLLGQSLLVWAFLAGHFTAWSIANLISVIGVTVALSAIAVTLRNFERRIEALAKLVGRSGRKRIRRRTAKISRK
jgi:ABC-type Fe3+ transport system permease subunit